MDISVCSDVSQLNESAEINVCRLPSEPNKATPQQFLQSSAINRFVHSAGLVLGVSSNKNYSSFVCTRVCVCGWSLYLRHVAGFVGMSASLFWKAFQTHRAVLI